MRGTPFCPLFTRVRGRNLLANSPRGGPRRSLRGGSRHALAKERCPCRRSLPSSLRRCATRSSYPTALGLDLLGRSRHASRIGASSCSLILSSWPTSTRGPLDRRARAAQLGVLAHEPRGVRVSGKHAHGFVVVGGCGHPLGGVGRGVVPVHPCPPSRKDAGAYVPDATRTKRPRGAVVLPPPLCARVRGRPIPGTASGRKGLDAGFGGRPRGYGILGTRKPRAGAGESRSRQGGEEQGPT